MAYVVQHWNRQTLDESVSDSCSFILDCEKENGSLARACLHLVHRGYSLDIHSVAEHLEQPSDPFYAHRHWFKHFEGSGDSGIPNLRSLADAMEGRV